MIESEIASIMAPKTGVLHTLIRKSLDAGKETPESEEERIKKTFEEERKKVAPVYNSQGKLIEYEESGRHLDIN